MRLAQSLMTDIRAGTYPVGSRLPTENDLCRQLRVSRHTVRDALRILVELGLVKRRPRAGTTVIAQQPGPRYQPSISSMSDLRLFAGLLQQKGLAVENLVVDAGLGASLDIPPGSRWTRATLLRMFPDDEIPLIYGEVYVPEVHGSVFMERSVGVWEPAPPPVHERIEARAGLRVAEVRQRISAVSLPGRAAGYLDVEPGEPGLELLLSYHAADGALVEVYRNLFRGDRYSYSTRMRLS